MKEAYVSDGTQQALDFEYWCERAGAVPTDRQFRKFKGLRGIVHQARVDSNTMAVRRVLFEEAS